MKSEELIGFSKRKRELINTALKTFRVITVYLLRCQTLMKLFLILINCNVRQKQYPTAFLPPPPVIIACRLFIVVSI